MKLQLKKTNISTQALLGVKGFSRNGIQTNGHGEISRYFGVKTTDTVIDDHDGDKAAEKWVIPD